MHVTKGVDNDMRTLTLGLDRIWSIGAGFSNKTNEHHYDLNFNLYDVDKGYTDTGSNPVRKIFMG